MASRTETHSFGVFAPKKSRYLLLGSFPGKRSEEDIMNGYDWFYGTKRNQFWPIMEEAFGLPLKTKAQKQALFERLGMAITDIILSCERRAGSNLDANLINIIFNDEAIGEIFKDHPIEEVFFSSRFVETMFRRHFKAIMAEHPRVRYSTLPSPSPRYAAMTRGEKARRYRELLPKLG